MITLLIVALIAGGLGFLLGLVVADFRERYRFVRSEQPIQIRMYLPTTKRVSASNIIAAWAEYANDLE